MSIFKCKMCGGTLEIQNNETVAVCEYCGTKQTLPRLDDEKRANLYDRANHFRRNNEFDKAAAIYEQILSEDGKDAEAYWSLVLCRYGIEYVEDPATHKRVPTVNRAQFTSIYADADYQAALEHADGYQRTVYEEEAKAIDEIQKGILAISQKEEPFDVFICYKETDNNGRRTPDSVLANDLYHQLTQEGFKVFFARITLEDKLGSAYEPYIFAALNSAKVMVVLGTKPEYFNAVWVKNEWSRFLALTKDGKKTLIPAYKDMDPYYLPPEFASLQAQDMSKLGFMQDLIRGIKKLISDDDSVVSASMHASETGASVSLLLKRAFRFLEDGDWKSANEYCEKVLDINPDCAEAYVGKLMAELHVRKQEELANSKQSIAKKSNYKNAQRLANPQLAGELTKIAETVELNYNKQQTKKRKLLIVVGILVILVLLILLFVFVIIPNGNYNDAVALKNAGKYSEAIAAFQKLDGYKDSEAQIKECEQLFLESQYRAAITFKDAGQYLEAIAAFKQLNDYKDSKQQISQCEMLYKESLYQSGLSKMNAGQYFEAIEIFESILDYKDVPNQLRESKYQYALELLAEEKYGESYAYFYELKDYKDSADKIEQYRIRMLQEQYDIALGLMADGKYSEAIQSFEILDGFKDSVAKIKECENILAYNKAVSLMNEGKYSEAITSFKNANGYKDSAAKIKECENILAYNKAVSLMNAGKYSEAIASFKNANGYKDSAAKIKECENILAYNKAVSLMNAGKYSEAFSLFASLGDYKDSANKQAECMAMIDKDESYRVAVSLMSNGDYKGALDAFKALNGYKDSNEKIKECENIIAYNNAVSLMNAGKYSEAITAFKALNGYKDSDEKIKECENIIAYNNAVSLMNAGKYSEAITAFKALNGYKDSDEKIKECENIIAYNNAVSLMNAGKYSEAITAFEKLNGYRDSAQQIEKCKMGIIKNSEKGDVIKFGTYEQDNNTANGKEEIEWIVLDKKDGKALIISKYGLDCQSYNTTHTRVTWETCTLRNWLNTTFYTTAFNANQQSKIASTTLINADNPEWETVGGNNTTDKVFLLSLDEAEQYFASNTARKLTVTAYAKARGAYVSNSNGDSYWWLRSPGSYGYYAAYVFPSGSVAYGGLSVSDGSHVVRPALWIDLES